uniref:Uncharacterized protein n=1 Tax=Octopus bimaculoides TaxID=37653 RepID=A0A0L8G270_OCTBM
MLVDMVSKKKIESDTRKLVLFDSVKKSEI